MIHETFIKDCLRTNAPGDKAIERFKETDLQDLIKTIQEISTLSEKLDKYKKAIFYGKNHKPVSCLTKTINKLKNIFRRKQLPDSSVYLNEQFIQTFHAIVGIQTESAELLDALLKVMVEGKEIDVVNVGEEIADGWWYNSLLCDTLKLNPSVLMEKVINKLKKRYPDKFTEASAINRDLQAERKILEG